MWKKTRNLTELKKKHKGEIYVFFDNEESCKRFFEDAEKDGYMFGTIKPTDNHWSKVIAMNDEKRLMYVNYIGRQKFGCGLVVGIDYNKYISGEKNYICKSF